MKAGRSALPEEGFMARLTRVVAHHYMEKSMAEMPSTRKHGQEIQSLLEEWNVPQKHKGRKRNFDDMKRDLVSRVVEETGRLKTMHEAAGAPILPAPALPAWVKHSAIQAALLKDTKRQKR